jgi:diguanylate cyclase (GGDEF)-like protein
MTILLSSLRAAFRETWRRGSSRFVDPAEQDAAVAAAVTKQYVTLALAMTVTYEVFYLVYDPLRLLPVLILNGLAAVAYSSAYLVGRAGHQRAASLVALLGPLVQFTLVSSGLSRRAGFHLFDLTVGVLAFLMLTDEQRVDRWIVVILSTVAFAFVHLTYPIERVSVQLSTVVLDRMFVVNGVCSVALLYTAAVVFHERLKSQRDLIAVQADLMANLAQTDVLTQVPNRRRLLDVLARNADAVQVPYTIALVDLDHFKRVNDTYGHAAGDVVLARVASILMASIRSSDVVGRWGGEEFILVMPATPLDRLGELLDRVREQVAVETIEYDDNRIRVTVSIGAADARGGMTYQDAMRIADDRLYVAKRRGRNRVVTSDDEPT